MSSNSGTGQYCNNREIIMGESSPETIRFKNQCSSNGGVVMGDLARKPSDWLGCVTNKRYR